ncbi:hypothetical protein PGTUg99_005638 [Puccinia graminis f. sp. tritici]|uniref:Uncharacterized protein n=1 Tax=Puccinia graminis f. sp. tritici TaxID=56615 RepID=A0A5B0S783_PUCGR|nr:hypothetical protein PGTUg99_005638 [Puccinia graminis f. sp. tritici]
MWDLGLSPPSESCRQLNSEMMADLLQRPPTHISRLAALFHVAGLAVLVNAFRLTSEPDGRTDAFSYDVGMMLSELELVIPLSVDLALHLYPAVLLWIDYLVFSDRFADSSSRKITLTKDIHLSIFQLTLLLTLAYVSRIELLCYFNSDIPLPYPFLNDVDFPVRVAIYSAAAGLCYMYSSIAESLHGLLFKA